jgi:hypothetical protein
MEAVYFKILTGAEVIRHDSDYDDFFRPTKEQAFKQYHNAMKFIEGIEEYIKKTGLR